MYSFAQVNVFSSNCLKGNPLAVVKCTSSPGEQKMLDFANWTNLSETTFLLPPKSPEADYHVRIFTPRGELSFAGHPTLGTCHVWLNGKTQQRIVQECGAGLVTILNEGNGLRFKIPPCTKESVDKAYIDATLAAVEVDPSQLVDSVRLVNGPQFTAILLKSEDTVLGAKPDYAQLQKLNPNKTAEACTVVGLCAIRKDGVLEVRSLIVNEGGEDPITGSLNAALAEWLIDAGRITAPYTANQGRSLGRQGLIKVTKDDEGIWIGGNVQTVITGEVSL